MSDREQIRRDLQAERERDEALEALRERGARKWESQ